MTEVVSDFRDLPLPDPGASRELLLPGAAGPIEAILAAPRELAQPLGYAVVCHPHPLYGGAMSNKVAYTLASCALKAGLYALRFNFRGVGRSEGRHDEGRGETEDALRLIEGLGQRLSGARYMLAGFSFGGYVSLMAALRSQPELLVSVAPPFGKKYVAEDPPETAPACPWMVLHSRDDELVAYEETAAAVRKLSSSAQMVALDGAGHFFNQKLGLITENAVPFIQQHWGR